MIPLFYTLVLGIVLWVSLGMYHATAILVLSLATVLFFFSNRLAAYREGTVPKIIAGATLLFIALAMLQPRILYVPIAMPMLASYFAIKLTLLIALVAYAVGLALSERRRYWAFVAVIILLFYTQFLTLMASPDPQIDVFMIDRDAVGYLFAGKNPYSIEFPDMYSGAYDYVPRFTYWPGLLLFTIPTWLMGDIRYATVICTALASVCFYWLNRNAGRNVTESQQGALLFLSFPVGLFMLEQAWVDSIPAALTVLTAVLFIKKRWLIACAVLGVIITTKQYGFLVAVPSLVYILRTVGWKKAAQGFGVMALVCTIIVGPFLLWDIKGFHTSTIDLLIGMPFRDDALSLVALCKRMLHFWPPGLLLLALYFATLGAGALFLLLKRSCTLRDWAFTLVAIHSVMFLFGKQAFCNYYYMLAVFTMIMVALRPKPGSPSHV
ncbi:hypothetical protein DB345_20520 [Spartobacteria bacterium LR76]|nr:hypothetical protein DB345_20520 [Spartobacteria bacterium LR76]